MSQFVRKQQEVLKDINMTLLERALADLSLRMDHSQKTAKNNYGNETVDARLVRVNTNESLPLGFAFLSENGKIRAELRGDFYRTGLHENSFMNEVAQMYQKHNVADQLEDQGWHIDSIETNQEKEIVIDAYQWA